MTKKKHSSKHEISDMEISYDYEADGAIEPETESEQYQNDYSFQRDMGDNVENEESYGHNRYKPSKQRHTHEFEGSTKLAELQDDPHNHRFAGVTGQAIKRGRSHVHKLETNTDFFDHFHEVIATTGPAIFVGNGRHVHFVMGRTTLNDGHRHNFIFATLIDRPIAD